MLNYEYLQEWLGAIEDIRMNEQLIENNLSMYQRTQDIRYLEIIIDNIREIFRLKQLYKKFSDRYYYILP